MLIVGNGLLVTLGERNRVIPGGAVATERGLVVAVGPTAELKARHPGAEFLDARGGLIMPGLVNVHTHAYGAFARGISLGGRPAKTFIEVLRGLWWKLDRALTPEDVFVSGLLGLVDCLKNGTTTVFDHHASPNAIGGSLDQMAKAAGAVGVRACLCYEVSDRDGPGRASEGIEENVRFAAGLAGGGSTLAALMGLHASMTLSDATLGRAVAEAGRLGIGCHIHCSEGPEDLADSRGRYDRSVVRRLADMGVLGPSSIAAHCVHTSPEDFELLAKTRSIVAHNPQSNMNNAVGVAPVLAMLAAGVRVVLGTDGFGNDLFEGAMAANIVHKLASRDPSVGWGEGQQMTLANAGEVATQFFGCRLGALTEGAGADLIVVDYDPPTELNPGNFWGHFLFGLRGGQVRHSVVAGRLVMRDRRVLGLDEAEVMARARELSAKVWERVAKL